MRDQIRHDGEYPFDFSFTCDQGHRHGVWQHHIRWIPEAAALALVGAEEGQWLLNKGFVVFAVEQETAFAVYLHDSSYHIIKSVYPHIVNKYLDERKPGDNPGSGGNLGMTMMMMSAPDEIEMSSAPCPR